MPAIPAFLLNPKVLLGGAAALVLAGLLFWVALLTSQKHAAQAQYKAAAAELATTKNSLTNVTAALKQCSDATAAAHQDLLQSQAAAAQAAQQNAEERAKSTKLSDALRQSAAATAKTPAAPNATACAKPSSTLVGADL